MIVDSSQNIKRIENLINLVPNQLGDIYISVPGYTKYVYIECSKLEVKEIVYPHKWKSELHIKLRYESKVDMYTPKPTGYNIDINFNPFLNSYIRGNND